MKRFRFNLEKILSLRANREHETELELGRAAGALSALENDLHGVAEAKHGAAALRFAQGRGMNEILSYELYIRRLDQTRDRLLERAAQAELAVEEARVAYLEASRDRKILDKLKERRKKEYRKLIAIEDIKTGDDSACGRAARSRIAAGQ